MFYLVPLQLQASPIWCKIPQVRTNNLSSGESEEDLGIGNLPSSCFLHNCEVDGDLSTVGGVPGDRARRSEPPRELKWYPWFPPVSISFLNRGQDWDHTRLDVGKSLVLFFWPSQNVLLTHICLRPSIFSFLFSTSFLCTFRLLQNFNCVRRGNMLTWTVAGVSWTLPSFLGRDFDCKNPND